MGARSSSTTHYSTMKNWISWGGEEHHDTFTLPTFLSLLSLRKWNLDRWSTSCAWAEKGVSRVRYVWFGQVPKYWMYFIDISCIVLQALQGLSWSHQCTTNAPSQCQRNKDGSWISHRISYFMLRRYGVYLVMSRYVYRNRNTYQISPFRHLVRGWKPQGVDVDVQVVRSCGLQQERSLGVGFQVTSAVQF